MKGSDNQIFIGYFLAVIFLVLMVFTLSLWWMAGIYLSIAFARGSIENKWFGFFSLNPMDIFFGDTGKSPGNSVTKKNAPGGMYGIWGHYDNNDNENSADAGNSDGGGGGDAGSG